MWICPEANGHIQATGTDAAGRRRYLYHPRFREQQEAAKHEHILEVAPALPLLRKHTAEDLKVRGLCRDRVLACAARLLDLGFRRALRALLRRRDDGERLFAYWQAGAWHDVRADDLNAYLRERTDTDLTAKDFRTWHATVLAAVALAVVRTGGRQCAVHRDENGQLHAVSARCTHLGCIVAFNSAEQAWECPCHGSRFAPDGQILQGPAVRQLEKRDM